MGGGGPLCPASLSGSRVCPQATAAARRCRTCDGVQGRDGEREDGGQVEAPAQADVHEESPRVQVHLGMGKGCVQGPEVTAGPRAPTPNLWPWCPIEEEGETPPNLPGTVLKGSPGCGQAVCRGRCCC